MPVAKAGASAKGSPRRQPLRDGLYRNRQLYASVAALIALVVFNALFTPNFLSMRTLNVNLTQVATIVIVATGMTLVIATGGIDLSVGALMAISGALAPMIFMNPSLQSLGIGVALAFILPVIATSVFGLFNGALITRFGIQPIIATLVLFIAGRGIAQVITGGNLVTFRNPDFQTIGLGRLFGLPFQVILMLVIVVAASYLLQKTVFGRYLLATGGNEAAARLAGVPVNRVKLAVYTISGALAGLAGLIAIAINASSDPNRVGLLMELNAIAAVAVGGTALTGGRATIIGTLLGALIIQLIRYTLLVKGVPEATALVVQAAIILLAVYFQRQQQV
ncbi:MAG: ABC transporter permease [Deinococcota bacterium]|nr:ABC transporter permease [Deinococcota bacterium]